MDVKVLVKVRERLERVDAVAVKIERRAPISAEIRGKAQCGKQYRPAQD